jgi:hypothetical protein
MFNKTAAVFSSEPTGIGKAGLMEMLSIFIRSRLERFEGKGNSAFGGNSDIFDDRVTADIVGEAVAVDRNGER